MYLCSFVYITQDHKFTWNKFILYAAQIRTIAVIICKNKSVQKYESLNYSKYNESSTETYIFHFPHPQRTKNAFKNNQTYYKCLAETKLNQVLTALSVPEAYSHSGVQTHSVKGV